MTEEQVESIVAIVVAKVESMIENRVNARRGTELEKKQARILVANALLGKKR